MQSSHMHISLLRILIRSLILHSKKIHFYGKDTNSKRQITDHIKSFRYEVVSLIAKTCYDGSLKHLKSLLIMRKGKIQC